MSRMLSKMNLISVVQQLPKEDIETIQGYVEMIEEENNKYKNQQKEFISYLENEKDRLARECSHIYENSLGKTRLVNEDIFNETRRDKVE